MQDKADVRFIDAHAKRIGCDHDRCIVVGKGLLVCAPFFVGKSGVIAGCPKTIRKQPVADLFDIFACCTVNDAGAVGMGEQIIADAAVLVLIVANLEIEIFRSKPVTATWGSDSSSIRMMSSRTSLVAVAVKAPMTGRMGSVRTNSGIFK